MIAMGLRYHVHCERCDRFTEIDMTKLPPDGPAINGLSGATDVEARPKRH